MAYIFTGVPPPQTNIPNAMVVGQPQTINTVVIPTNAPPETPVRQPDKSTFSPGAFCFKKAPLEQVLKVYAALSGRVVLRPSSLPTQLQISYENRTPLTQEEALKALERVLAKQHIILFPQGPKFVKAFALGATLQD